MANISYWLVYGLTYIISLLPFKAMYLLADLVYIVTYYIIRYRRKIVRKNIKTSFPEKSKEEVVDIERKFYRWFCDYVFETFKLLSISEKKLLEHFEMNGLDVMEEYFDRGQDAAAILGHYCNWEWLSAVGIAYKRYYDNVKVGLIYHRLRNAAMDRLFRKLRSNHKGECVHKKKILRFIAKYRGENRRTLLGYISDQAPKWENIHLFIPFLNHDTPVFTGGERIMRKMKNAVFFVEMERPKRGKYIANFKLITDEPQNLPPNEVTIRFFNMLEQSIRRQPEFYLWTHNRWKRTKEEFERRQSSDVGNPTS